MHEAVLVRAAKAAAAPLGGRTEGFPTQHTCVAAAALRKMRAQVLTRTCSAVLSRFTSLSSPSTACLNMRRSLAGKLSGSALPMPGICILWSWLRTCPRFHAAGRSIRSKMQRPDAEASRLALSVT